VPAGAVLHSCDGQDARAMLGQHVAPFWGQPSLPHTHARLAWRLAFTLAGDRGAQPKSCRFLNATGEPGEAVALNWQPISFEAANAPRMQSLGGTPQREAAHEWADLGGGVWRVSVPSFNLNGDARKAQRAAFEEALAAIKARDWKANERLVIDLRGNTGGNSAFGRALAAAVWGDDAASRANNRLDWTVDWRVSPANIAHARRFAELVRANSFVQSMGWSQLAASMESALERGEPLMRSGSSKAKVDTAAIAHQQVAQVDVLTDEMCASACLDFMDLALMFEGVRHIGQPTSADSLYMDVQSIDLPSGRASLVVPLKVYRNRVRGHQVFYTPTLRLDASALDDAALKAAASKRAS
jgi:hypothetical protein